MAPTPPALLRSCREFDNVMRNQDRSNASLARLVGCRRQTIQKLRSGKATGCGTALADAIESVLGVAPGGLFIQKRGVKMTYAVQDEVIR